MTLNIGRNMLRNYFTIALRNLKKHRGYTFINLAGLTGGITCCLLILLFILHEFSYDLFQGKIERIYRVAYEAPNGYKLARTPPPMAPLMSEYFPEVENAARLYNRDLGIRTVNEAEEIQLEEPDVYFADSAITRIFTFETIAGNLHRALSDPFSLAISRKTALKYFNNTDVIGKMLVLDGKQNFRIGAVFEDYPAHSHLHLQVLVPYHHMYDLEDKHYAGFMKENLNQNWVISHGYTYVLLHPNANPAEVDRKMNDFVNQYAPEQTRVGQIFTLQPLEDIHLKSDLMAEPEPAGSLTTIFIFSAVALITLLIACINFINLSINRYQNRIKEVGIRKVLGAARKQLVYQFIGESVFLTLLAVLISLLMVKLFLPVLNVLTLKTLDFSFLFQPQVILMLIFLILFTGVIAGSYPAFYISRFQPVISLKGRVEQPSGSVFSMRKFLVVVQFAFSAGLIAAAMVVYNQVQFIKNKPLGFDKEQMLTVPLFSENMNRIFGGVDGKLRERLNTFENEINQIPGVTGSTLSSTLPGTGSVNRGIVPEGFTAEDHLFVASMSVDYDFLPTYDLELVAGRNFNREAGADHIEAFIVNETAVNQFNWQSPREALGKTIDREGKKGVVIGVVKDFIFQPVYQPMSALVMDVQVPLFNIFSIRMKTDKPKETLARLEEQWIRIFPEKTFVYTFLQENIYEAYQADVRFGKLIGIFALLAIMISALGSYGLVSYTARKKTREIGIRKVLGASAGGILVMLSKEFTFLVLISMVIAFPVAYHFMSDWLGNFAFRTELNWTIFLVSAMICLLIVWFSVGYQSIRAATVNPASALKED
jgi:putative ABC transport system permease protein